MPLEIERKYLIKNDKWRQLPIEAVKELTQSYIQRTCDIHIIFCDQDQITLRFADKGHNFSSLVQVTSDDYRDFKKIQELPEFDLDTNLLTKGKRMSCRLRLETEGDKKTGYFTVKKDTGDSEINNEFQIPVPYEFAAQVIAAICVDTVNKTRHVIPYEGFKWEVDQFHGTLSKLFIAEVEVKDPSLFETMKKLPSAGKNVTAVKGISNKDLGRHGIPDSIKALLKL